jgi:hypothetical protein
MFESLMIEEWGNKFYGSLEPLKNLNKLKRINISNSDIDSGLESLPKNLKEISCSNRERPESKVGKLVEQLNFSNSFALVDDEYTIKIQKGK